jgi:hypothetical protein
MFAIDLSLSAGRPSTASGVPPSFGAPDGVIQSEAGAFLQVEAGQYLAFD